MSFFQALGGAARRGTTRLSHLVTKVLRPTVSDIRTWLTTRRTAVILEPYRRTTTLKAYFLGALALLALGLFCTAYGFMFGLMAPYLFVAFVAPIAVIAVLVIWALPDSRTAPTYGLELLFPATLIVTVLWPDYVAIALPGLPWITLLRLVNFPLAGLLLICLSVSSTFRSEFAQTCRMTKPLWIFLGGFILEQVVTLGISSNKVASTQIVVLFQVGCTALLVIAALTFREARYVERFLALLCAIAIPLYVLGIYEETRQHVLWAGHIPAFLRIQDPSVQAMLASIFRMYAGKYRVKTTFRTPLALAEYLALLTPFLLYFACTPRKIPFRVISAAMIPLNFYIIRQTDSQLGVVGTLVSVLVYGLLVSIIRWRQRSRDLFAAAVVYAYPLLFCVAVGLVFSSHRVHDMVLGGGSHVGSTAARSAQVAVAMPKVWANPFGYGAGQDGLMMGYAPGDFITVDNYFVVLILDYGIPGVIFWYGMFIVGIFWAVKYSTSSRHMNQPEAQCLIPLATCLTAFLIIKWVHGQDDNHPVLFSLLGMIVALVYRIKTLEKRDAIHLQPR